MSSNFPRSIVALSGGVGGAKLVLGLSKLLSPDELTVVTNTGDDFSHLGLTICPDLDTVLYTLADWNNKDVGWGQDGETWQFMEAMRRLGGESWFNLGDRDLATHIVRSQLLDTGLGLSEVVEALGQKMQIAHKVVPMTDDEVRTIVKTRDQGELAFQHYFVRDRCEPYVTGFEFRGINAAAPSSGFSAALDAHLEAVVICPSNPFVSVDPILSIPGVVNKIRAQDVPVIVVSNIVGGQALKGPAAKMMAELGMPQTAFGVAEHYARQYPGLVKGFVIDPADSDHEPAICDLGFSTVVTPSVMISLEDKTRLGEAVLGLAKSLADAGLKS